MSKIITFFCSVFFLTFNIYADGNESSSAFNKYMSPEGGVNPLSGTVALSKSLASISVGDVSVNFDLSYSGNIFKEVETRNDQTSGSLVGLGWSFGRARIISDNRGTSYVKDDQFYLVTSSNARFKIFEYNKKWWIEGNPYMKIEQILDSADVTGSGDRITFVKGWKLLDTKGITHIYGDLDETKSLTDPQNVQKSTEYDLFWPLKEKKTLSLGLVGKAIDGEPLFYPTVWNVSKEIDVENKYLLYYYEQIFETLGGVFNNKRSWNSGKGYTKESYLKEVVSSKNARLKFTYENKGMDEFFGETLDNQGLDEQIDDVITDMFIEKVSRKYLSSIETIDENGDTFGTINLCYSMLKPTDVQGDPKEGYVKRLLSAVKYFNKKGIESDFEEYNYYTNTDSAATVADGRSYPLGALHAVKGKECGWVEYEYKYESLGNGHSESVPVDSIFGKGYLEDGTAYLVGKSGKTKIKIFNRIQGNWVNVKDDIKTTDVGSVSFGDQGWFLLQDKISKSKTKASVYQWNGKEWTNVFAKEFKNDGYSSMLDDSKNVSSVIPGPDYVVYANIANDDGFLGFGASSSVKFQIVWSKWGDTMQIGGDINDVMVNPSALQVSPQKNHILLKINNKDWSNSTEFYVFSFNSKGKLTKTHSDKGLDNDNMYYLADDHFVEVGEPTSYVGGDSRFRAWVWTGSDWFREYKDTFGNDGSYTAMDLQAHGENYYAVRHHSKRYLTTYYWNGTKWSTPVRHKQLLTYAWFSSAWKWIGFSGNDFYLTAHGRVKHKWGSGWKVYKSVYLNLFYNKNDNWSNIYIGSLNDKKTEKKVITGDDWFIETNVIQKAWIWDGNTWNQNELLDVPNVKNAYSLGGNAFAVSSGENTTIYYKIGNTFKGTYGSYRVQKKTIFEPVVDKTIEYIYSFDNKLGNIAYDEANNTPLFKVMYVTLPGNKGTLRNTLCSGYDSKTGEYNVGLGSSCIEEQLGTTEDFVLSKKKTLFERYRNSSWPKRVYQDRVANETSLNGGIKNTTAYTYSDKNGLLSSTTKKMGSKTTEEVIKYLVDFESSIDNFDSKIKNSNRIESIAGSYSCINSCANGRVIAANANGWLTVDSIYRSVSSWKMAPKETMTKSKVESGIKNIAIDGSKTTYANWMRSSYNSEYQDGHVVETQEGHRNVKISSFMDNKTFRLYGTAANCGVNEGLMLSGESCDVNNWSGCLLADDGVTGYAVNGQTGSQYGRFSAKVLRLSSKKPLIGSISSPLNKKYHFSAWVQSFDSDSIDVVVKMGSKTETIKILTGGKWKKIETDFDAQSASSLLFTLETNSSSEIHLQDIRVLPFNATSSALFWNNEWNKVQTKVDNRGVGSYVVYDDQGREVETYSETEDGSVYMVSRKTFVDGSCNVKSTANKLEQLKINGKSYGNLSKNQTFVIDALDVNVELKIAEKSDGVRYSLYKSGSKETLTWKAPCCGALSPLSFDFDEATSWTLLVDVQPINSGDNADYTFYINKRTNDWVEYGQVAGFADGEGPKYLDPTDSMSVVYKSEEGGVPLYKATFNQNSWIASSYPVIDENITEFDVASKNNKQYVSFIPDFSNTGDNSLSLEYAKTYYSNQGSVFGYLDMKDQSFRAENLRTAVNSEGNPVIVFRKDLVVNKDSLVNDSLLYGKVWNPSMGVWKNMGSLPVFDQDSFEVKVVGKDTIVSVKHGNITSYIDGAVCDYNNSDVNVVNGPDGTLYVAYIGNPNTFGSLQNIEDGDTSFSGKMAPGLVLVKRLYSASETSLNRSIWAGPSQISGTPQYEGDVVSWDGTIFHALENAQSIQLASDDKNLYLAVVYATDKEDDENDTSDVEVHDFALTVFKGTFESNVSANGVTYSKFLRWTPLQDKSIAFAKKETVLDDEQKRVLYMTANDAFDLEVRNGVPYIMFRNKDNGNKISVIKHNGTRWLSVGNPAFAFPVQTDKSTDLGVSSQGSPFVVFKQGLTKEYKKRKNKLVAMHYNAESAIDLSLSSLDFNDDSLNIACSFRQYILNYYANVGYKGSISLTAVPKTSKDVSRMDVYVNDSCVQTWANNGVTPTFNLSLMEGMNRIELRIVGSDESMLIYKVNMYRKPIANPDAWAVTYTDAVEMKLNEYGVLILDATPLLINPTPTGILSRDSVKIDLHFTSGWTTCYNDTCFTENTWVTIFNDTLSKIIFISPDNDTVPVKVIIKNDSLEQKVLIASSSSTASSSSGNYDPDAPGEFGGTVESSSSSSYSVSDNVPTSIRELSGKSQIMAVGNLKIGNDVTVSGPLYAGNKVEIGVASIASDNIVSGGDISLSNRASTQNLFLVGNLNLQDGASYNSLIKLNSLDVPSLPTYPFTTGADDIMIEREQIVAISAGAYKSFTVREKSTISFAAGDYYFDSFWVDPNVTLKFAEGTRVWIANTFNIGNFCIVEHGGDIGDLFVYIQSSNYVTIGNNTQMRAVLYAPNATVQIYDHTIFEGFVWSANFGIEPFSVLK